MYNCKKHELIYILKGGEKGVPICTYNNVVSADLWIKRQ